MISALSLQNFRGFESISFSDMKPITLLSGKNNVGKSSILEGIFLYMDHSNTEAFSKIARFRNMFVNYNSVRIWEPFFYGMDPSNDIIIKLRLDGTPGRLQYTRDTAYTPSYDGSISPDSFNQFISSAQTAYTLKFTFSQGNYREDGHFIASSTWIQSGIQPWIQPGIQQTGIIKNIETSLNNNQILLMPSTLFINANIISSNENSVVEWMSRVELKGEKQKIIDTMRILEPEISDIFTVVREGQAQLYVRVRGNTLPLKLAGDGLIRLLYIVLAIIENPNSYILIDEIENGLHYSMYESLWKLIARSAIASNTQVIATTHSYECIVGAAMGINSVDAQDNFCFYRLEKENGKCRCLRYPHDILLSAIKSELEVR